MHNNETYYAVEEKNGYTVLGQNPDGNFRAFNRILPKSEVKLLTPVAPSKIIGVGLNYRSHAQELDMPIPENPIIFFKPLSSLNDPGDSVQYPVASQQLDYEGELAVVIGTKGRCIPKQRALEYVMGYTLANDITARDLQKKDGQWTRAKGFDGFCPLGPCIVTGVEPWGIEFKTYLNGELKQTGKVSDMIFTIPHLIAFISEIMTLLPGDVILTGTPLGVGPMQPGDVVKVECETIGALENRIVKF